MSRKQVIGAPLVIDGRVLSLSPAVRAGDFVFVTGQVPMRDGKPMTDGSIEDQTHACLQSLQQILAEAGCELGDVVKSMVWLKNREDFGGFNSVYAEYFPTEPPTRSALVSDFLIDILELLLQAGPIETIFEPTEQVTPGFISTCNQVIQGIGIIHTGR